MDDRSAQDVRGQDLAARDSVLVVDASGVVVDARESRGALLRARPGSPLADCDTRIVAELVELWAAAAKSNTTVARREAHDDGRVIEIEAVALRDGHVALLVADVSARRRAEAREAALASITGDAAFVLQADGTIVAATAPASAALGRNDLAGRDLTALVHGDDRGRLLELLAGLSGERPLTLRVAAGDGGFRSLEIRAAPAGADELVVCGRDVTDQRGDVALLAAQHAVLDHFVGLQQLGYALDVVARFVEAQAAGGQAALYVARDERLELAAAPTLPRVWARASADLVLPPSDAAAPAALHGAVLELAAEHGCGVGWIVAARDGASEPLGAVVLLAPGPKRFASLVERDAMAAAAALSAFAIGHEHAAAADRERERRDPLTGVLHRPALLDALAARAHDELALVLVHVEDLGAINQAFGYDAGDTVLRAVAAELRGVVRARDVVGRLRGSTFAIAGPLARGHDPAAMQTRLGAALPSRVAARGHRVEVRTSLVHAGSAPDEQPLDLLARAETLLTERAERPGTRSGTGPSLR